MEPNHKKSKTTHTENSSSSAKDDENFEIEDSQLHKAFSALSNARQEGGSMHKPPIRVTARAAGRAVNSLEDYHSLHQLSLTKPDDFWGKVAREELHWIRPFDSVSQGGFDAGDVAWFVGGQLNVSENCIDRHIAKRGDQIAVIYEGDKPSEVKKLTYRELLTEVCKTANALKSVGVRKGDRVAICIKVNMPMIPQALFTMLACARIGAVHSVVFGGFSAESLRDRILNAHCEILVTADEGLRGGKVIHMKKIADEAVLECPCIRKVLVHPHTHNKKISWHEGRDVWLNELTAKQRPYCPPEPMNSEDPLFLLYTSGSTGAPKGLMHTTGGYLLYAAYTHKHIFDIQEGDVYACMADVGWITGHSYIVYGPLANGATTFLFESVPTFPDAGRYWDMVQRHKINIFYTAPTAIRTLMAFGTDFVKKYDRSSLRVLGSVGEPINPEAWKWYSSVVGDDQCAVVDTYWQTETGGIVVTPLPGAIPTKPGSATLPFFGIEPAVLDSQTGKELVGNNVNGVLAFKRPWPGMARTVYGDHPRYLTTYFSQYKGYYFTGDGVIRDEHGYYWITGRVDDVINKAGHRIGTAEIESALVGHASCAEAAVVGIDDAVRGQAIFAYVSLVQTPDFKNDEEAVAILRQEVRKRIGALAAPDYIVITPSLPKTRSGKIMRRLLRKLASGEFNSLGDTSTLADPDALVALTTKVQAVLAKKPAA